MALSRKSGEDRRESFERKKMLLQTDEIFARSTEESLAVRHRLELLFRGQLQDSVLEEIQHQVALSYIHAARDTYLEIIARLGSSAGTSAV